MVYIEVQEKWLPIREMPKGNGWQIFSGNRTHNTWYRIVDVSNEKNPAALLHTGHFVAAEKSTVI